MKKGFIVTHANIATIWGRINAYLSKRKNVLQTIELVGVSNINQAMKLAQQTKDGWKTIHNSGYFSTRDAYPYMTIGEVISADEHGGYVTIHDDRRYSKKQPPTGGHTVWITPQGIFIKTTKGITVVTGELGEVEILSYSAKQLCYSVDTPTKWENDSTEELSYYDGKIFTDRRKAGSEPCPWEDAVVIFKGIIDDRKFSYKEENQYWLWRELENQIDSSEKELVADEVE